ncbi:MAG: ribonuclease HII [Dehalococcoidia bacterium]|nr:ribonuclease HII [Dehalococcoidia bacterium]
MGIFLAVPTLNAEITAWRQGRRHVAGVDEAGRGPLAGPVVAAAVILEPGAPRAWWSELRDSKMLVEAERERLAALIRSECAFGVGVVSHTLIDSLGLIAATKRAMREALAALPLRPDLLLIDAESLPEYRHRSVIHGDALCCSIAAGSIVAKVARDQIMAAYHETFPAYGFDHNRGYSTPEHLQALDETGPCAIHRRRFAPVRAALEGRSAVAAAAALIARERSPVTASE